MRSLFVLIGVVVIFMLLVSSGTLTGNVCVKNVGCLRGDSGGLRLESNGSTTPALPATTTP